MKCLKNDCDCGSCACDMGIIDMQHITTCIDSMIIGIIQIASSSKNIHDEPRIKAISVNLEPTKDGFNPKKTEVSTSICDISIETVDQIEKACLDGAELARAQGVPTERVFIFDYDSKARTVTITSKHVIPSTNEGG